MTENSTETTEPVAYEKGSWQEALQKSSIRLDQSAKARKIASTLLWKGAKEGIEGWLPESTTDVSAEGLYGDVIEALGRSRKGDASKIKTVAVAVRVHSLDLSTFPNLSKAYAAARALTVVADQQDEEDNAADEAIASIEAPKSTSSVEGAAALLLSKGVDGAVVAILDALGKENEAAHRAFLRAVSVETSSRVKAKADAVAAEKKAVSDAKRAEEAAKKAAQPKPAKKAAAPVATKAKGKPASKGKPVKAAEPEVEATEEDGSENAVETPDVPVANKAKGKGRPVVQRPSK